MDICSVNESMTFLSNNGQLEKSPSYILIFVVHRSLYLVKIINANMRMRKIDDKEMLSGNRPRHLLLLPDHLP